MPKSDANSASPKLNFWYDYAQNNNFKDQD
jgi:hypothetical protein